MLLISQRYGSPEYVHVDINSEYLCLWMFYYTCQRDMDAMQYVNIYVPSGPTFYQTFYYSHHSDMKAPQYVHVDVPSDYFCHWTF